MSEKIFRKRSLDRVTGPEQLDDYIRVAGPSLWVALGAVGVLLAAAFVWGMFSALPATIPASGVVKDGEATIYLPVEQAAKVREGMPVKAGDVAGMVKSVAKMPLSGAEVRAALQSDYLAEMLHLTDWNIPVTADVPGLPDGVVPVAVTVESVRPLDFLTN